MNIPHEFATKREEKLSLAWIDENNAAIVNKCNELEGRLIAAGQIAADMAAQLIALTDKISKLQPKKKSFWSNET